MTRIRAERVVHVSHVAGLFTALVEIDIAEEYVNLRAPEELEYGVMVDFISNCDLVFISK